MRRSRAALALIAGSAAVAAGVLARQVWHTIHRPDLPSFTNQDISGSWGERSLPPLNIVAVGDSSLTAPGLDDLDDAWLRRLARQYAGRHRVELTSLGVGGSRAADVVSGTLGAAAGLGADVAVVSVGGNDVIRAVPLRRFSRALETIIDRLEASSGAVLLVGVGDLGAIRRLPPLLRPLLTARSARFDRECSRLAAGRRHLVKAEGRPPQDAARHGAPEMFAADQFHASAAGHARYAEVIAPFFAEACRRALVARSAPERS